MIGILYLLLFLCAGIFLVRCLLPQHPVMNRLWLGISLGFLLMMWLPALWAFAFSFGVKAHVFAACTLPVICFAVYLMRDRRKVSAWNAKEKQLLMQTSAVCIPLTILSAYLQYTHIMRVDAWGNWNVGQSTYGDLPMHLAFITGLKNASFPPDYPFFPGQTLSYPFLADSLSTTFYLLGWSLQLATILPAVCMMGLCFFGVMVLARDMTRGRKTVVFAALLFFLNGGLGFLYDFDQAAGYEYDGTLTLVERVRFILQGYYKTPTNQPEPNNLRWSNLIADLLVPQRTLMGGYCMVIPCLYLLYSVYSPEQREKRGSFRAAALLGVWGGALPMIHTHSFLALGLASVGYMVYDVFHGKEKGRIIKQYLFYALIALALALPQLLGFTFRQVFEEESGTGNFIRFQFNWVNNPGGQGMRDFYFWFYIKNIGLPFVLLILACFEKDAHMRRILAAVLPIVLAAELIRFQPNEYDNNKLFYLAYLLSTMVIADYSAMLYRKLKGLRARPLIAAVSVTVMFLSAGLTLWRECVSSYQAFAADAVEAGMYARENTEEDSVFLSGRQHLNPISSIAGRVTVCGPDLWLYWHGIDTSERNADIASFMTFPESNLNVLKKYDVDYIYISSYERSSYAVDTDAMDRLFERVFENDEAVIYAVREADLE